MKCKECGEELEFSSRFCPGCGTPVPQEQRDKYHPVLGDKSVVSGDITFDDSTQIHGGYNVTKNIYAANNFLTCSYCGRIVTPDMGAYTCLSCGHIVCDSCYDSKRKICSSCIEKEINSKQNEFVKLIEKDAELLQERLQNNPGYLITEHDMNSYTVFSSLRLIQEYASQQVSVEKLSHSINKRTLLHYVLYCNATKDAKDIVSYLINKGASPKVKDINEDTPLSLLIKSSQKSIKRKLDIILKNSHLTIKDILDDIIDAVRDSQFDGSLWKSLLKGVYSSTEITKETNRLIDYTSKNYDDLAYAPIRQMVLSGADCNYAYSVLFTACRYGITEEALNIIKLLIAAGANPNHEKLRGKRSPISLVCQYNHTTYSIQIIDILLKANVNCNLPDKDGYTALYYAQNSQSPYSKEISKLLNR